LIFLAGVSGGLYLWAGKESKNRANAKTEKEIKDKLALTEAQKKEAEKKTMMTLNLKSSKHLFIYMHVCLLKPYSTIAYTVIS